MKKISKLNHAREFVGSFQKIGTIEDMLVNSANLGKSLKILANKGDEENFKTLTEKYFKIVQSSGNQSLIDESYSILKKMCLGMDNMYRDGYIELHPRKMRKGSATKLYEKIYSPGERK